MCGIFGIVTSIEVNLGPTLVEAGKWLSYRGYDTVGCATLKKDRSIDLRKDVGKIDEVAERLVFGEMTGSRGILQLRWATFGAPSQANAQPHIDSDGDLVGAHNGNVVNNVELRRQFISEGMTVRSTNDGETCVHAVERYINRGHDFINAIQLAYQDLAGDYAFVIGRIGEDNLHAIKKGSGLIVGIADGFTCLSSDLPSILPLTRTVLRVQDGEIVTIWPDRVELRRVEDGSLVFREFELITENMESAKKGGYPHFMLKEINEQPVVAAEMLNLLSNKVDLDLLAKRAHSARNLFLIGCGTSYHACMLGSLYISQIAGKASIPVLAPQFIAQYGPTLSKEDVGVFVSQSGETKDVINALKIATTSGMGILGIVNVIGSTLTQESENYLPLACGYEISVPATKTFTNQVLALLIMAMRMKNLDLSPLGLLPELMQSVIDQSITQVQLLGDILAKQDDMYCLGYGLTYPIALEGALKLKEITYAHCEGMLSTEFKHGPLSAVQDGYPVIFVSGNQDTHLIISGINEVTCRGGIAIVIGEENSSLRANADHLITLPTTEPHINAILSVIPLQILSYQLSIARGYDPDFPRNLSKTLTVD